MSTFKPYIESQTIRTAVQPTTGGIETLAYDRFRQGVSITNDKHRYAGTLPTLGSGDINHFAEIFTLGQKSTTVEYATWNLVDRFDPVSYIKNTYTPKAPDRIMGFIEPLGINNRYTDIQGKFAHRVRGSIAGGNIDKYEKSDFIFITWELEHDNNKNSVFLDSLDKIGTTGNDIQLQRTSSINEKMIKPFIESAVVGKILQSGSIDIHLREAVLAMTGSSTEKYINFGHKSASRGFTYNNAQGVDSIAFGGLIR